MIFPNNSIAQTNDDWNRFRLAQSYESLGNYDKAFELYRELYLRFPTQFQFYDAYYRMLTQLKKYDEAIELVKNRLNQTPNDFSLYGELAVLYDRKGLKDSMNYYLDLGINYDSRNPMSYKIIANVLIQNRMFEQANYILETGKSRTNEKEIFSIDLININTILMNYSKVISEMIELINRQPQQITFVQNKLSQIISNPSAQSLAIEAFEKNSGKNNLSILKILSWLYFQKKDFKKAFDLTLQIDKLSKSNGYEILDFSNKAFQNGFIEEAIDGYEYLIKNHNNQKDIVAMSVIGLARSYEYAFENQLNSPELKWKFYKSVLNPDDKSLNESIKYYTIIINQYTLPDLVAEALYKLAYFNKEYIKDYLSARNFLEKIISSYILTPFYSKALLLYIEIEMNQKNFEKALELYDKLRITSRANETERYLGQLHYSEILIHKGLIDSAKSILGTIKSATTNDIANDAIEMLMIINEIENQPEKLKLLLEITSLIDSKDYHPAIQKIKSVNFNDDYSIFENKLRYTLAELYITTNNYSDALAQLNYLYQLKEKSIYSDRALYRIGQLYLWGLKDKTRSEEIFNKLLAEFPNSIFVTEVRNLIQSIQSENF